MKRFKMWQEFKILILTSVGRKRQKITVNQEKKNRRHSCPPENRDSVSKKSTNVSETSSNYSEINGELQPDQKINGNMTLNRKPSPEDDILVDLNHSGAKHRIAVRPNNRRVPSRLANNMPSGEDSEKTGLTRSASLSSLDFIQIQEECSALLKTKSHSFKALPALFFIDENIKQSSLGPNVIMVRTLPTMRMSLRSNGSNDIINNTKFISNDNDCSPSEEQQEKFRLSIANWCLANEGLRKSIQSLKPPPLSLCVSSESLTSICSGLQALDSELADVTEINEDEAEESKMDDHETSSSSADSASSTIAAEDDAEEIDDVEHISDAESSFNSLVPDEIIIPSPSSDDVQKIEQVINDIINAEDDVGVEINGNEDDGLMNVNVKERRHCLMQMLNDHVIRSAIDLDQNATMSRMAAKNAAVVKMAVENLNNLKNKFEAKNGSNSPETESIIAMETNSKVKLMVSKFDNSKSSVTALND